ncbi:hypothetical protein A2U01_0085870, partial [Trifolium medium]|nr:hypothetical protein [Trifolium medium]
MVGKSFLGTCSSVEMSFFKESPKKIPTWMGVTQKDKQPMSDGFGPSMVDVEEGLPRPGLGPR